MLISPESKSTRVKSTPVPGVDTLDRAVIAYLTLPLGIFLVGWFEWWVAGPLMACSAYALKPLFAAERPTEGRGLPTEGRRLPVTRLQFLVALAAGCGWALLGGADHIVFANADWFVRDAVLHDLVASPWPVGYGLLEGRESLLRAPVAFYLPAAVVGKIMGLGAAHVAMGLWTAAGTTLFLLQVLSLTPSRVGVALTVTAVVVLFSGLDIVGSLLNDGPRFRADWNITTHLEWWAGRFQYSSMTTQLFWVPNHALGGWLSIGLLARRTRNDARDARDAVNPPYAVNTLDALWPLIVVALALWSPLTAVGLVPFVLLRLGSDWVSGRSLNLLHPRVWAPAAAVGVVVAAYLVLDPGRIPKGLALGGRDSSPVLDLLGQLQFFMLEAGFLGAAILSLRRSVEISVGSIEISLALVILALLPLVYFGPFNDLVMRASIPSLAVLAMAAGLALVDQSAGGTSPGKKAVLVALLLVGAVTPIEEFARAILLPAWPINMAATLIGANCGGYAPHYVARLGEGGIARLMRPTHRLPLGPQGPEVCRNPALELMFSWRFFPRSTGEVIMPVSRGLGKGRGGPGNARGGSGSARGESGNP